MRIARVFPRRTNVTPDDELVFTGTPELFMPEIDEVHISQTFTYDAKRVDWLYHQWEQVGVPVHVGGPAFGMPSGEFVPGRYMKQGHVITSRGCNNRCWFCDVPKREGDIRELPIVDGYILHDDNILQCSEDHIRAVFAMLKRQPERPRLQAIEAKLLMPWHCELFADAKVSHLYCAYDTEDDYEPLVDAGKLLHEYGMNYHQMFCYVLIGYPDDTKEKAENRLRKTMKAGFSPFAMLYKTDEGKILDRWNHFQYEWANIQKVMTKMKEVQG